MQGMKITYFCKCGRIVRKSTDADNTGNRDVKDCTGCPYLLPWGKQAHSPEKGWYLDVKGYECRVSQKLEYASCFVGCTSDMGVCSVVSLDYDFLSQISDWIHRTCTNGELIGEFSRKSIRPTDFSNKGRYRYSIYCAKNKKGRAAKAVLLEHFFNPDGSRKDMAPEEEERKIKDLIENGKRAAQGGSAEAVQTPAVPEPKQDVLAAENQIFVDPNGVKYRIGIEKGFGKKTYWRTERMDNGEWIPNNSSSYPKFENAQGEFAACIRVHSLVPMEPENGDSAVAAALPAVSAAAEAGDTTEALATVPDVLPAFDYSGLDAETATRLQNLARRALESKQRYYLDMMEIVYEAHLELVAQCDKRSNQYSETTFRAWCASIGVGKDTAYRLLQVQALMDNSTPEEQEVLEQAPAKLLYAAAKPSAPAEAVAAVRSGDITTYKEYQELMKRIKLLETQNQSLLHSYETEKGKAEAAKQRAANVEKDMDNLIAENDENIEKLHKTREQLEAKEREVRDAKNAKEITQQSLNQVSYDLESTRSMLKKAQKRANMIETERNDTVARLESTRAELAAMRTRPIEVAVAEPDPAEIERLATEKAESIAAQRTALLEAQMHGMQQDMNDLRDSAYQAKASSVDTVFAFAVNAAGTIDTLRETFLELAKDLQEDDFFSALQPLSDAAWKIADLEANFANPEEPVDSVFDESEAAEA